jgi:hypothetical protein
MLWVRPQCVGRGRWTRAAGFVLQQAGARDLLMGSPFNQRDARRGAPPIKWEA